MTSSGNLVVRVQDKNLEIRLEKGETFITNTVLSVTTHDFGSYLILQPYPYRDICYNRKFVIDFDLFFCLLQQNQVAGLKSTRKLYKWKNINTTQV